MNVIGLVSILGTIAAIAVLAEIVSWCIGNESRAENHPRSLGTSGKAKSSNSNGPGKAAAMSQEPAIPAHTLRY
jgi:hypothetical protein